MSQQQQLNKYESYIFDVWGILYDGKKPLPYAVEALKHLQNNNKNVYLLSNAPRPAAIIHKKMSDLGLEVPLQNVMTSGQLYIDMLKSGNFSEPTYVVGHNKYDLTPVTDNVNCVDNPKDAKHLLFLAFAETDEDVAKYKKILDDLIQHNLNFICVNPDITVLHDTHEIKCQGYFAKYYESIGGSASYFGKPHNNVYEHLFSIHNINKDNALMLGDSMATDITGAHNFGIDSALLMTGVHKSERNVANLVKKYSIEPVYILNDLKALYEDTKAISNL